jgi:signal transduction histidine kinase
MNSDIMVDKKYNYRESLPSVSIIEDDQGLNHLIQKNLQRLGYQTNGFFCGSEALTNLVNNPDTILLLDYLLPDMNGKEFIKKLNCSYNIPFIVMTGHGDEKVAVEMMKLGAKDYIIKDQHFYDFIPEIVKRVNKDLENEKKLNLVEKALRESEIQKKAILDGISAKIIFINQDFEILWLNKTAAASTGKSTGELIGNKCYQYFNKKSKPCDLCPAMESFKTKKSASAIINDLDGKVWENRSEPVFNTEGKLMGVVEISQDITELKKASELAAINKELETFSYSISHDLRAPLRHINGFIGILKENLFNKLDEKCNYYLNTIVETTKQMNKLIDDLLEFSHLSRKELNKQEIDLNSIIETEIKNLTSELKKRNMEWKIAALPVIRGDAILIRQVLVNLLANAVKFTRSRKNTKIEIGHISEKAETVFYIRDNGIGFNMNNADKLFGVFQRLHRAEDFEGTGIGLANVKRIIERHGGRVWADGKVNKGATFYFSIPNKKG